MLIKKNTIVIIALAIISIGTQVQGRPMRTSHAKSTSGVKVATTKTFKKMVLQSNQPSVVLFYAEWCGHCNHFKPEFEKLAKEHQNINFVKVNAIAESSLGDRYVDEGYPTIVLFKDGKDVAYPDANRSAINRSIQENF